MRNPINRIISCYINRYGEFLEQIQKNYTFKEFINLIYDNKLIDKWGHIIPQFTGHYNCILEYNENFKFDEVYKIEDLNMNNFIKENIFNNKYDVEKLNYISNSTKKNNLTINVCYNIPLNEIKIIPNYKSFLNVEIVEKIKKIYKVDYEYFKLYNINYD